MNLCYNLFIPVLVFGGLQSSEAKAYCSRV